MALRIALVAGPMYDHIERAFAPGEVEIVVKADHPTLNRTVAEMLSAGIRIDVLATHSKYAPSQAQWLIPLDDQTDDGLRIDTTELAPSAVELCKFQQRQWCIPRLIDVRLLWSRADRVPTPPRNWTELVESSAVFGFTGRESGAFGFFFELVVGAGGQLFDDALQPTMNSVLAVEALEIMARLAQRAPSELPNWHYDDVDRALLEGRVDLAAAWPGGWSAIAASKLALTPSLYPAGSARRVSYSGCHAWAVPRTCGDLHGAAEFIQRLSSLAVQSLDASGGSMCAHTNAMATVDPINSVDQQRLDLTRHTINEMMITYPPLPTFPVIESGASTTISALLRGELSSTQAADRIQHLAKMATEVGP
jgi:multiple sugar transport system substrate-binding protein